MESWVGNGVQVNGFCRVQARFSLLGAQACLWVQLWCLWAASRVTPVRARPEPLETSGSYLAQSCAREKMQESPLQFVGGAGVPVLLHSA